MNHRIDRRALHRHARLASGLILFVYVATHLANHGLGSISMATAERGLRIAVAVWQSLPGTALLYGAATTHVALAFAAVHERRTLRMPPLELLRMILGFAMPTLLIGHAVATRAAATLYGHPPDYAHVVWMLEHSGRQGWQIALLVPGWLHGCLGLRFAFGRRAWFARVRPVLSGAALLLPVLAVLGFVAMTKEVNVLAADPTWPPRMAAAPGARASLDLLRDRLLLAYAAAIVAMLLARHLRASIAARRGTLVSITYPDRIVRVPAGWSVLEASRAHAIGHRSTCGGQGRCSTCRVHVTAGASACPAPGDIERGTLARIGAGPDIRLACQLRPRSNITVVPLFRAGPSRTGREDALEREVVACRVDLRWSRAFDRLLPHDRLYAIRRVHDAVETVTNGGVLAIAERTADHVTLWAATGRIEDKRRVLRSASALAAALDEATREVVRTTACAAEPVIALHRDIGVVDDGSAVGNAFDAVEFVMRGVMRRPAKPIATDAAAARLLVSTRLLPDPAPALARSAPLHADLRDGGRVPFVEVTPHSTRRLGDEAPRGIAKAALERLLYG